MLVGSAASVIGPVSASSRLASAKASSERFARVSGTACDLPAPRRPAASLGGLALGRGVVSCNLRFTVVLPRAALFEDCVRGVDAGRHQGGIGPVRDLRVQGRNVVLESLSGPGPARRAEEYERVARSGPCTQVVFPTGAGPRVPRDGLASQRVPRIVAAGTASSPAHRRGSGEGPARPAASVPFPSSLPPRLASPVPVSFPSLALPLSILRLTHSSPVPLSSAPEPSAPSHLSPASVPTGSGGLRIDPPDLRRAHRGQQPIVRPLQGPAPGATVRPAHVRASCMPRERAPLGVVTVALVHVR